MSSLQKEVKKGQSRPLNAFTAAKGFIRKAMCEIMCNHILLSKATTVKIVVKASPGSEIVIDILERLLVGAKNQTGNRNKKAFQVKSKLKLCAMRQQGSASGKE